MRNLKLLKKTYDIYYLVCLNKISSLRSIPLIVIRALFTVTASVCIFLDLCQTSSQYAHHSLLQCIVVVLRSTSVLLRLCE